VDNSDGIRVDAFVESVSKKSTAEAPPWTPEARAAEIETLARAHELDRAAISEIEQALAKAG